VSVIKITSTKAAYFVRPADAYKDRDIILATCRTGGLTISDEQYRWKYEANPLGPARCWLVVEGKHDSAVGHLALFPREMLVRGYCCRAAVVGDFVVHPAHRTFWPAVLLQRAALSACRPGQFPLLYTFPNQVAHSVLLRAGYRSLGHFRAGVRLLKTQAALQDGRHGPTLPWAAGAIDAALRWLSKETWYSRGDMYLEELSEFDARFNVFWAKILREFTHIIRRDASYANWRFMCAVHRHYSISALMKSPTAEVMGYIVWSCTAGKVLISDALVFDDALEQLFGEFIRMQRQRNASSIVIAYFGGPAFARKLQQFGFLFRRSATEAIVCTDSEFFPATSSSDPEGWYFIDGDADV